MRIRCAWSKWYTTNSTKYLYLFKVEYVRMCTLTVHRNPYVDHGSKIIRPHHLDNSYKYNVNNTIQYTLSINT